MDNVFLESTKASGLAVGSLEHRANEMEREDIIAHTVSGALNAPGKVAEVLAEALNGFTILLGAVAECGDVPQSGAVIVRVKMFTNGVI